MISENRPWGSYTILYTGLECQVKRIEVNPGQRLSLQTHQFRTEHWFIVSGTGTVQVGDATFDVFAGSSVDIRIGEKHRIAANHGAPLSFIEVQSGISFDEHDIVRYEDDYERTT